MKKVTMIILAIACVCLICGAFYFIAVNKDGEQEKELTKTEKLIYKDLDKSYPETPRAVVVLFNNIWECYHDDATTKEQLGQLVDQMMKLFDEELLLVNDRETYYASVLAEVKSYDDRDRHIGNIEVCDRKEVEKIPDKEKNDEVAYVDVTYLIRENAQVKKTNQTFVLRQDADGNWKIVTFYLAKGENS